MGLEFLLRGVRAVRNSVIETVKVVSIAGIGLYMLACGGEANPANQPVKDADGYSTNDPGYSNDSYDATLYLDAKPLEDVKPTEDVAVKTDVPAIGDEGYDTGDEAGTADDGSEPDQGDDGLDALLGSLEVEQDDGKVADDGVVVNTKPTADFTYDAKVIVGKAVQFIATAFDKETPAEQLSYSWDFTNDGVGDATGSKAEFTFDKAGEYTVALTVSDGELEKIVKKIVVVKDVANPKKKVNIYVHDILSGKEIGGLTFTVKNSDGEIAASGVGNNALLELLPGSYTVTVNDNPVSAAEFEYLKDKKMKLTGDYSTDFMSLVDHLKNEGLDTIMLNATLAAFEGAVIGKYHALEFVVDVAENDITAEKQMIPQFGLDTVAYVLEDGNVNVTGTLDFVAKYLWLYPYTQDMRPLQWKNGSPLKVYVPEASGNGVDYKTAFLSAMDQWQENNVMSNKEVKPGETKQSFVLYELVDTANNADVVVSFDSGFPKTVTKHNYDFLSDPYVVVKANVQIKPENNNKDQKSVSAHELYHVNSGLPDEGTIIDTIALQPLIGLVSNPEAKTITLAFRATTEFTMDQYQLK